MYQLSVETEFCAAHAILIGGRREPTHGHNWRVTLTVSGPSLDDDGLLCDFHAVEAALRETVRPLDSADLNASQAFASLNPTAEHVARHICETTARALSGVLPRGARVESCRVTEAPGCAATFFPGSAS